MRLDLALYLAATLARAAALPPSASARGTSAGAAQDPPEASGDDADGSQDGKSLRDRIRDRQRAALPVVPELKRADGSVVKPGELPPGASPAARERWTSLASELTRDEPVSSFQLQFYLCLLYTSDAADDLA